jgi:hypothetical protein
MLYNARYLSIRSHNQDSNPTHPAYRAGALPDELLWQIADVGNRTLLSQEYEPFHSLAKDIIAYTLCYV